jgi:hypothetical protein
MQRRVSMTIKTASWRGIGLALLALFGLGENPVWSSEPQSQGPASLVKSIELDECDPFTVRSKIMEVSPGRGTLVVVEREVRDMDVETGSRRIKTSYLNREGKPEAREAFHAGEYVRVEGFLHPDGYVAAAVIQKIEKPVEKKTNYKPIERSKKGSRRVRTASVSR